MVDRMRGFSAEELRQAEELGRRNSPRTRLNGHQGRAGKAEARGGGGLGELYLPPGGAQPRAQLGGRQAGEPDRKFIKVGGTHGSKSKGMTCSPPGGRGAAAPTGATAGAAPCALGRRAARAGNADQARR